MRSKKRLHYLSPALALFVPLLALAVLGALEMQRQGAQVADAVQQQADAFLRDVREGFEERMRQRTTAALQLVRLDDKSLVAQTQAAIAGDELVRGLFVLDSHGNLLYPVLPDPRESTTPFLPPVGHEDVRQAERLLQFGTADVLPRAVSLLRRALERGLSANDRARALFRLGVAQQRQGDATAAVGSFQEVRAVASASTHSPAGIDMLARLAIAEAKADAEELLSLANAIAAGEYAAVPDALGSTVLARALDTAAASKNGPSAQNLAATRAAVLALDRVRRQGCAFAAEFARHAAPALQRSLPEERQSPVLRTLAAGPASALLALRRIHDDEHAALSGVLRSSPHWVGLSLDLPALATKVLSEFRDVRSRYVVALIDPDGAPLSGAAPPEEDAPAALTVAGLVLVARPVDAEASLRESRAAIRNRVLILAALVAVALAGGYLLLRTMARDAELATLKMEFVSRMSHELKTPLALIKMYGETLAMQRAKDAAQAAHFGDIVAREADRLSDQIERILSFARQQSETLSYTPQPIDLCAAVDSVVEEYGDHVARRGCALGSRLPDHAVRVRVDPHALRLTLASLIENAVKYTPASHPVRDVTVEVAVAGDRAVLAVHDHGIGIPAGERERVFEAFYRASNAGEVRGAGLGLSQAAHFVAAHGGDIAALSSAGGGTTIRICLPLFDDASRQPQRAPDPPAELDDPAKVQESA